HDILPRPSRHCDSRMANLPSLVSTNFTFFRALRFRSKSMIRRVGLEYNTMVRDSVMIGLPCGSSQSKVAESDPDFLPLFSSPIFFNTILPFLPSCCETSLPQKSYPLTSPCANQRPR